jgi:Family of unknown function (DUF5990)
MKAELHLRIILERPPAGVDFGLQKGRGSRYETIQKQRSDGGDVRFEFAVQVKDDRSGQPNFTGPVVQGPPGARFFYLDIGIYAGQTETSWSRRLKVPLSRITWAMVDGLAKDPASLLEIRVPGTGKDGSPSCGTAKLVAGWEVAPA